MILALYESCDREYYALNYNFICERRLLLTNDLKLMLQSQFDRLAEIEKQVVCALADRDRFLFQI
jgi:hypothetical protein